ncbi:unnamed protein product [Orchesella dallaii]|uniref:Uncharacterized protein n=1 Tax=Orchesella dallaii TaxID=48710 RepID=A0ABP1S4V6_9HEXA
MVHIENEINNAENVENQPPTDLTFAFKQDHRFSMNTEVEDRRIHLGEPFELQLADNFLDYEKFQEVEEFHPYDLTGVTEEENQRAINMLMLEEKEVVKRQIIRRQFPLRVTVVNGVMYSPSLKVVLESFQKIKEIRQANIDPVRIYENYVPVPRRLRVPRVAMREAMHMNAQEMEEEDVEMFHEPLPLPPQRASTPRPLPPNNHQPLRASHDVAGSSQDAHQFRTPYGGMKRTYADVAKTPRKICEPSVFRATHNNVVRRINFEDIENEPPQKRGQILFQWFDADSMGICHDRDNSKPTKVTPSSNSISAAIRRHADDQSMTVCNSIKVGESMFGSSGMVTVTLFKQSNFYSGHCIPISLRECPSVITAMIHAYYRGCMKLCQLRLDEEVTNTPSLDEEDMDDVNLRDDTANERYERRMRFIKEAYEEFKDRLKE